MSDQAWLVLRDRGASGITAVLYTPFGVQMSPVRHGIDECDARRRALTPGRMRLLNRLHPRAEVVVVQPDDPIPDDLRRAFRSIWGGFYEGRPDEHRGAVQEPPDSQLDLGA